MEEVLVFLGFSLGASFGAGMVRSIAAGPGPTLRGVLKTGILAWDGLARATAGGKQGLADVHAEALAEQSAPRAGRPRRTTTRKITIARE